MPTIYPSAPYFDDYDSTKQFYRILFRPGRAVQARELTQLQTLIQGQIERFGKGIYKDGSFVTPSELVFDRRYAYVKLQATYSSVNADDVIANLLDQTIEGQTNGVKAQVINFTTSTATDPPTLFVKYLNSGDLGLSKTFADNEIIVNEEGDISVRALSSSATGNGTAFSVGEGSMFVKGVFVAVNSQTKILQKYSTVSNSIIGFQVTESVVTSDDDSSLFDPAIDTYNYFAPGSDRYKIDLSISTRNFTPSAVDDPNFIELCRIENGTIISLNEDPQFSILGDTLARRTYDESGDYVVKPYSIKLFEHLRATNNANATFSEVDGLYTSDQGGDSDLFVNIISPGKAYVKGYEIDSVKTRYLNAEKARDYISVNNQPIATPIGNYVYVTGLYSVPDFSSIVNLQIYDKFTTANGTPSGNQIGTARARGLEFYSGTAGTLDAVYKLYLFDIRTNQGKTFVDNAKQFYFNNSVNADFSANIKSVKTYLTGTVNFTTSNTNVIGIGTLFTTELKVGDFLDADTGNSSVRLQVSSILNNNFLDVSAAPSAAKNGVKYSIEKAKVEEATKSTYIFKLPQDVIKSIDSTSSETVYSTKRQYERTLSSGTVTLIAGTDEVFAPITSTNYAIVVSVNGSTGPAAGVYIDPTSSGLLTRGGSPTGKTLVIDCTGVGLSASQTIQIITTVQKNNSAAVRKSKTLVQSLEIPFDDVEDATSSTLSLGKADVFRLREVSMSATAFGTSYSSTGAINITNRYILDNGQRPTYYDVGKLNLKSNAPKPTGPLRVTFDYFTHGTGDFFSVESYSGINYKDIPSFTNGETTFQLRDCLDFRPRIDDTGEDFSSSGSSPTELISQQTDFLTDYEYYLPRTDKLVVDKNGIFSVVKGISSLTPQEPNVPDDCVALYVLKQRPYVFDLYNDIDILTVNNKRYTMRDIGRIETRVKNLEYYTSLNLLEIDAEKFQVQDSDGFDRFKNGFIVDSFSGHGVGDTKNPDYSVAVDMNKQELRPLCEINRVPLLEVNSTNTQRSSNNYALVGEYFTLPYTEVEYVINDKASKAININPFNIGTYVGVMTLSPAVDSWFETKRDPDVLINKEGNYNSLVAESQAKGTFGTVWGAWRDLHFGNNGTILYQQREGTEYTVRERIDTTTKNDVVKSTAVLPKMRNVVINMKCEGLKPNTVVNVFFNNYPVNPYCTLDLAALSDTIRFSGNPSLGSYADSRNNFLTDQNGKVIINFHYTADVFKFNTGNYTLRVTDSLSNDPEDTETFAEAIFSSSGELRNIANEITATRNAVLDSKTVSDNRSVPQTPTPTPTPTPPNPPPPSKPKLYFVDYLYKYVLSREPDREGYAFWSTRFREQGVNNALLNAVQTSTELLTANQLRGTAVGFNFQNPGARPNVPVTYNAEALKLADVLTQFAGVAIHNMILQIELNVPGRSGAGALAFDYYYGIKDFVNVAGLGWTEEEIRNNAARSIGNAIVVCIANPSSSFAWYQDAIDAKTNGLDPAAYWISSGNFNTGVRG